MAEVAGEAPAEAPAAEGLMQSISRTIVMMLAVNVATSFLKGGASKAPRDLRPTMRSPADPPPPPREPSALEKMIQARMPPGPAAPTFDVVDSLGMRLPPQSNVWAEGSPMEMHIYLSSYEVFDLATSTHLLSETGLSYDFAKPNAREHSFNMSAEGVAEAAWRNASVYAHIFVSRVAGFDAAAYEPSSDVLQSVSPLTKHLAPPKTKAGRSLLEKSNESLAAPSASTALVAAEGEVVSEATVYWKPTLRVRAVVLQQDFQRGSMPAQISTALRFDEAGNYYPYVYVDEFWLTRSLLVAVNDTVSLLPCEFTYDSVGFLKWQMQRSMEQQWESQRSMGLANDGESDVIREMLSDTKPWLLVLTALVSVLHMVFEALAFRSNVKFWRNKKTLEGLSARTIALNCVFQTVILLYLMDNDTSWMILMSSGVGLLTELFKMSKALTLTRDAVTGKLSLKTEESYALSETRVYDQIATSHLLFAVVPLLVGYSSYSLVTGTHKGWYSWIISSLVGFIYAFGFVMMTPQLYINYRLQSVAHLPWRAMVFKSLNTFIDDLFAFIIKMPTMHRLSCLRDDIIFIITLYQRYIYRVDMTRVNEFGQGGGDDDDDKAQDPTTDDDARALENKPNSDSPNHTQDDAHDGPADPPASDLD